jgi:hypothetical protein
MRPLTWLVVGALGALAVFAAADALRGGEEVRARQPAQSSAPAVRGILYYTDEDCRLRAVRLPRLRPLTPPVWSECRFVLSPDGERVSADSSFWSSDGSRLVVVTEGGLQVFSGGGPEGRPLQGSAPAFRPDGRLTYFRDGAVVWETRDRIVLSAGELREAFGQDARARLGTHVVRAAAWLDSTRLVLVLDGEMDFGREEVVAVYEGRALVSAIPSEGWRFGRIWTSPGGNFFAVETESFLLFDRDGRPRSAPFFVGFRSLAWSPDERWTAVATEEGVHLFPTATRSPRVRRLPIVARDLAWR